MANDKDIKSSHALREERIMALWKDKKIFERSLEKDSPKGEFVFYDGPPFANGLPHYGHILAGVMKDVVPRWKTMQGYHVSRCWGWDCHGLPVENLIEKELNLKSKKDILTYGVGKFNAAARESVMRYADSWRVIVPRLGRWVDMENDYRTMDASYTESVWWIFKKLYDKGLIYEGFKSMSLCPRCETTLSNFEVAQGYKDITDISVYVKFRLSGNVGNSNNIQENIYLLAWTTTPWTLPGNVALAIGSDIDYVKIKINNELYILAKSRLLVLKDTKYDIIEEFKGSVLVGMSYEPLFDYYSKNQSLKNIENGWKIYGADFVTTEDGTGIVHIAPAFGSDDYELLKKNSLPFVQHVATDGTFRKEVTDFVGLHVKPIDNEREKDAHQKTDIEIIKWLAHNNKLFSKEKIVHSYPHCWRCDTPLLNYAASSWFVKVTDIKDQLITENNKVVWVPKEVGEGRFGNWLMGARDWAISRSRFWGAPIPVWREEGNGGVAENVHVIGSIDDIRQYSRAKNTYYVMRHGLAENNTKNILDARIDTKYSLTEQGHRQVEEASIELKDKKIDLIVCSPVLRTVETANIVADKLGLSRELVIKDQELGEYNAGIFDGKSVSELGKSCVDTDRFIWRPKDGENYADIKKRMGDFIYSVDKKYSGKTILLVTHETPALLLFMASFGAKNEKVTDYRPNGDFMKNAEIRKLDFIPLPHNVDYELDLHRPFIDDIELTTKEGKRLTRVPDVFDCWFESGSMPYASKHYPFENLDVFEPGSKLFRNAKGFPADFIAEGVDQTRGWFYSMLVLGVALFGKSPYKKVIVNGLVLAEDGEKMAKRKQNYPDPMNLVQKYGADSLRYYLLSSPVVHGQDLCFSERGVDEVTKKLVNRLLNVLSFYETYIGVTEVEDSEAKKLDMKSLNILDQWLISRLGEIVLQVTNALEAGELDRASRPFMDFTDDLSTWYLRRSRERFKGEDTAGKAAVLRTTRFVLIEISKLMAPFMPFLAEDIYHRVRGSLESVHLETWPKPLKIDSELIHNMQIVRDVASKALEARMKVKINVRQPLQRLNVGSKALGIDNKFGETFEQLIMDEVNIKEVVFDGSIGSEVELDTVITPVLKEEGMVREFIRLVQDLRKEKGLSVSDRVELFVETSAECKSFIQRNEKSISLATSLKSIVFVSVQGTSQSIGDFMVTLDIK